MQEQLITFETAVLAKEKGFDIPTRNFIADESWKDDSIFNCTEVGYPEFTSDMESDSGFGDITKVPTQSLLQRWLREIHNIDVLVTSVKGYELTRYVSKIYRNKMWIKLVGHSLNYENTFEKGLQEGLKLIN